MKLAFWRSAPPVPATAPAAYTEQKRHRRSMMGSVLGMFKSAEANPLDRWTSTPVSPDQFISRRQMTLVARSREQWSNNDYVRGFIRMVRQNVVGPQGVTMQAKVETPRGKPDDAANKAIEDGWCAWGKKGVCDVTGMLSWRQAQCLAVETTARDGEFFIRKIYGDDAGAHGFALQFIDPQRLPVWYENYQKMASGGFIRHGIEFNRYGRPVAYHFGSTDESDAYYYTYAGSGFSRIPAEQIIHGFVPELVGQRRGLPWASTSLFRLHHLQGFEDASVQNARAGATKMGFIEYDSGFGPEADDDTDVADTIDAEPLSFHELPEGAHFKEFNPNYPSGEFQTFHKAMLRGASTGMGVAYNGLANDLEGVNFSSMRSGALDEREHWKECQQWLIEALIEPVRAEWLQLQLLRGSLKVGSKPLEASRLDYYSPCDWQPRRWPWVDPRADVESEVSSIRGGIKSASAVIREAGRDPETVFKEIASDLVAMKAAGISDEIIHQFFFGIPPPPPKPDPAKKAE